MDGNRIYAPLVVTHPVVVAVVHCSECRQRFVTGDVTTLVAIDPRAAGRVESRLQHARCAGATDAEIFAAGREHERLFPGGA